MADRSTPRSWLRAVVLAVAAVLVVWAGVEGLRVLRDRKPALTAVKSLVPLVKVSPAALGPTERELALPGDITAFEESPVYARVNGYVKTWTVDIGARVKAGDLLAEIEVPELHQQLKQAQALVLQAKANVEI